MADQQPQQQQQHHPLPSPPAPQTQDQAFDDHDYNYQQPQHPQHHQQQQQQQQQQPRSPYQQPQHPAPVHQSTASHQRQASKPRTFSFQSNKSQKSAGSKPDHHETHAEKEANRLHSKADPTMAISEAEPAAYQAMTKNSLTPLRSIQHRDSYGNAISEPDRSNPTRSRWERPLDTIRSFEAAIDGAYSRKSYIRPDTDSAANWNRRASYYSSNTPRFPQDSYYGGRPNSMMRPESTHMDFQRQNRSGYFDGVQPNGDNYAHNGGGGGYNNAGPSRQRTPRMMSEPMNGYGRGDQQQQQHVYPLPHKDRSYETVTTAAGSGSSGEQAGYQTDPTSSDNSSIHHAPAPKPANDYGIGFNQQASFQPAAFNFANGARNGGPGGYTQQGAPQAAPAQMGPPPVPQKTGGVLLRKQSSAKQAPVQQLKSEAGDKRKSWFSRRFSKTS